MITEPLDDGPEKTGDKVSGMVSLEVLPVRGSHANSSTTVVAVRVNFPVPTVCRALFLFFVPLVWGEILGGMEGMKRGRAGI